MHTDEYEISIGREVTLCRKLIKRLRSSLSEKEKKYGLSTRAFLDALSQGRLSADNPDFRNWSDEHLELENWERLLSGYEEELRKLKSEH